MIEKMKARCIYCGGDVYYHSGQQLIKCEWCGQTLMTAKFENELIRMKKTEEENALVKKQLARAEKEKQAADDRLFAALSSLGEIRDEQDALGKILHMLAADQGEELENLQFMKDIAAKLVSSQEDIFARMSTMQEIAAHLQQIDMDAQKRQSVMNDFVSWSQQIRKEDLQRLNEIEVSAGQLLEGQRKIRQKVSQLQQAAGQHQQTLEAFRGQYTKDKLKEMQKLYQEENISMGGGCLPLIIRMVFMLSVYQLVTNPQNYKYINADVIKYNLFALDLTETPVFGWNVVEAWQDIWLIPILAFAAQMLTSVISMAMQKKLNPDAPSMAGMMLAMPLVTLFIGFSVPGAVGFYWICSTVIGSGIQFAVQALYGPQKMLAKERAKDIVKVYNEEKKYIDKRVED
jgi:YidC/Oxa1 family membrane protein insertase